MSQDYLIGIDIGTQGTKAALFDLDGNCLAESFRSSSLYRPSSGIVEEDPEKQLRAVCQTIKDCVEKSKVNVSSVAAIAIDGQMAGVIGIGKDGRNVTPYDSWLDTRCAPYILKMEKSAGVAILNKVGNAPSFNHGPKKLWWKHEHPKVYKQIASFVQPGGYAAMRLCGLDSSKAFIDRTYLHFSGFADNRNNKWDLGLCETFDLSPAKLPLIVEPDQIVGELTSAMAKRCGLIAGVPVAAGCGDTAASFLACGAVKKGICVDVAGTASVFAATTDMFKADKSRILGCGQAAVKGLWHPYAYINGGGMNLEWFRKELANAGKISDKGISFDELNRLAGKLSIDENIPYFVPHFGGRVCPPVPDLRGAWVGLGWNHKIEHLYKAILESVALEYGIYNQTLKGMYPQMKIEEVRVTGGGEKSVLWNTIKSAVFQTPVVQIQNKQGAPMGSAMLAGVGVGLFKDVASVASKWVKKGQSFKAGVKEKKLYQEKVLNYQRILNLLSRL